MKGSCYLAIILHPDLRLPHVFVLDAPALDDDCVGHELQVGPERGTASCQEGLNRVSL